ncbi:MarR family winged helix-turn-helix transcriptional regulator [Muriicola sp. Z0-33]|uniref:MarR family winged helix-turn-helix transcriptional regulator n=1 Tax=Muriicola sp. Z0-33 TaxID=2816957 RepID=UPI0022387516|nr:MarR family transcriptional regulator [Muriicola sp. Z0-33]MCW5517874.1 MarR family transcriptional regulator [Muriicola sp. Z0-33]
MNETNTVSRLEHVLFYVVEKSIKSYRQFAQHNINKVNNNITIDQWLILKTIHDNPNITQREIAEYVFKDHASITRMINLLVKKGFLERSVHSQDRRRFGLELTPLGKKTKEELMPVIWQNREIALEGLSKEEISTLRKTLQKITKNCTKV